MSALEHPDILKEKVQKEITLGRIVGPFKEPPLPFLRCSPVGLVPKKPDDPSDPLEKPKFRFIHDLSTFPKGKSVNCYVDKADSTVQYTSFDEVVNALSKLGKGALMCRSDIRSAFRLLPCRVQDFKNLGFTVEGEFYVNKSMPMGAACSCATFEKFATFLEWCVKDVARVDSFLSHYLDDYISYGPPGTNIAQYILDTFHAVCQELGIPVSPEKILNQTTCLIFLGLIINTILQEVRVPQDKLIEVKDKILDFISRSKVTLRELQSLIGSLNFLCRAVAPGRPFVRRLAFLTRNVIEPHFKVRLPAWAKADLQLWLHFLKAYNGVTFFRDLDWVDNTELSLYTDSSNIGLGLYFNGKFAYSTWPANTDKWLISTAFMEIFPIAICLLLWAEQLTNKKVLFYCDNKSTVQIINNLSSSCPQIMKVVRCIVLTTLKYNVTLRSVHLPGKKNVLCDSLSRLQLQRFWENAPPSTDKQPTPIPPEVWEIC